MSKTTKEEMAAMLGGREYGNEITSNEEKIAKENGLFVIFGYSDDNMEVRGLQYDELSCWGGELFLMDSKGVLPWGSVSDMETEFEEEIREFFDRKKIAVKLEACWCKDGTDAAWTYETQVPHATFNIYEDGELFCVGLVIDFKDLPQVEGGAK
jgi:hypothetical protein